MKCINCNKEVDDNKNFCPSCGTKLGECTLIVTRKKKAMGFAIPFPIYVDGNKIGDIQNGKTITYNLIKGKHTVSINSVEKNMEKEFTFDDEHKCFEIVFCAQMGLVAARPNIISFQYK